MYLVRKYTELSFPIGRAFGNRDHATVQHACKKIKTELRRTSIPDCRPGPRAKSAADRPPSQGVRSLWDRPVSADGQWTTGGILHRARFSAPRPYGDPASVRAAAEEGALERPDRTLPARQDLQLQLLGISADQWMANSVRPDGAPVNLYIERIN
jgi:hypothetical protein